MKRFFALKITIIAAIVILLSSCGEQEDLVNIGFGRPIVTDTLGVQYGNKKTYSDSPDGQLVTFMHEFKQLKGRLYIPEGEGTFPAVVVMHGCTGLWDDADNGIMKSSYEEWAQIFHSQEKYIVLFLDSYTPRNIDEFCEVAPPQDFDCSPVFERNRDAYGALKFLRGINKVQDDKVALMGFSHGGTATLSAMVDYDYVEKPSIFDWRQYSGGWLDYEDGVRAPMAAPEEGGFVCAVSYYPGAAMYSYFGSIYNPNSGKYRPYAPILLNAAQLDKLYDDPDDDKPGKTVVFVERAELNGASVENGNQVELVVYENANHTFDGKVNGADGQANLDAKENTLNFLEEYLK